MSLLKRWGMSAAVVFLLAAAALAGFVPWLTRLRWALVIVAGVLIIATAAANWREGASFLGRRGTRYGASGALLVVLALGLVVMANAVVKVTRSGKRIVYVLKGHGEREIGNTERPGLSRAKDELEKVNYEVKDLVLARDPKVPADASVLIIAGPRTDLFPQELEAIDAYLTRGGKVFFMADPFQA